MRRFNDDRSFIRPPRSHNAPRVFLAQCLHQLSAHVLASAPRGASPHHHGQVSPQRPALATRQRHGMAHPDPQLPPSHRRESTSAPPGNRWARDLPPSRMRPRTPTPLHTRLLLRGQHPPPRHLRGGSRHSHHPRNLLPPTYRCPDPCLSHDEQPRPRPLPHTHGRDGPTATYDSTPFEQAHQLHSRLPEAMSTERLRGVEALIHPTRITSSDPAFLHLLPHLLVTAEAAWHGSVTLPRKQLSPLIDNELTYLRHTVAYWKTPRT